MSIHLKIEQLSDVTKQQIDEDTNLNYTHVIKRSGKQIFKTYHFHSITDEHCIIPFSYCLTNYPSCRKKRSEYYPFTTEATKCIAIPRPEQREIIKESISQLKSTGSTMISAYPGFGKTCCSIILACKIKLRVLVIVNKVLLMTQWKDSITAFSPDASICCLTPAIIKKKKNIPECDFYIVNAINIPKLDKKFLHTVGNVIVDEAHLIMAESLSRSLHCLQPRNLIGLTATPYRPDGLDTLLTLYFGSHRIIRKLAREHIVYTVNTGFKPIVKFTNDGTMNWGSVLDSQASDTGRNKIITDIVANHPDRNILIMVKRVSQGEYLNKTLIHNNERVDTLLGKSQTFDKDARVLIGTTQKVGTGFDHNRLDMLILAADVDEYFIQYLGRIFRTKEGIPIVFDLVDDNYTLQKHFKSRCSVYTEHGGTIRQYNPPS